MNIIFVSYNYWPPHFGGELKISIERFETLTTHGHSIKVLTSGVPGMSNYEVHNGIEIKRSPKIHDSRWGRGLRRLLFPLWVVLNLGNIDFDILHFGNIGGIDPIANCLGMLLVIIMAKVKTAKTIYVHNLADKENETFTNIGFKYRIRNVWLKRMDAIVSVSPALYEGVSRFHPERSYLIPCGVRDDIFDIPNPDKREAFRRENGIVDENCVFSFLGTISERKGFDLITEAFLKLNIQYPDWRLWVIGPKSKMESQNISQSIVDNLIEPLSDLGEKVKFWGKINDREHLAEILGASDVLLFPSRKEGFGIAPVEAMACGVPPIIARIPGVTDLANIEGETGLYCEVGDIGSLISAMIELGTNEELRKKIGGAARERVVQDFGWEAHINQWEKLYYNLSEGES